MILVVLVVVFLAAAGLSFLGGNVIPTILYGILALYTAVALLINILQFSRMEEFVEGIYLDCTPALERSEKNGYFLLGIFFSPLAATRFARTKAFVFSNRQELFRIMQEQDRRFESTFRSDMLHSNHLIKNGGQRSSVFLQKTENRYRKSGNRYRKSKKNSV